ncbi:leucine-rich repeat-containing protein 3B isoform X1 [Paramisgurnus dabryanus]|uniref:leucine-rich repeat-containing protein 3B isoform X1 n=1 Tax=Paramisgurnus dabryanus TaxID=90735 RepID=UPI0031F3DC80
MRWPAAFLLLRLTSCIILHGLDVSVSEFQPAVGCPESCFCSDMVNGGLVVSCSNMHLLTVPHGFPNTTQHLYLDNNLLAIIPSDSFIGLTMLCGLDLSHNRLTHLEPGAFRGLADSLISLDLSSNQLETLDPEVLGDIRAHTNLSHNPWQCDCRLQLAMPQLLLDPSSLAEVVCNRSEPEELRAQGLPFILVATDVDFCRGFRKTTDVVMLITMFVWFTMVISYLVCYVRHNQEDALRHLEYLMSLPKIQGR